MRHGSASALILLSLAGLAIEACGGSDADDPGAAGGTGCKAADGGIESGTGGSSASGGTGGSGASGGSGGTGGSAGDAGGLVCPPDEDGDNIPDAIEGKAE